MERDRAIEALVEYARLVSDATASSEILRQLAHALCAHAGADGACIVEVASTGELRVAAVAGLPESAMQVVLDRDAMGEELGRAVTAACPGYTRVETRLLVASGNLFGAAVLLYASSSSPAEVSRVAQGLIDLAAIALADAAQVARLEASNAELRASHAVLARTEKVRALGQMAAGVSHDLKNILNPLSLHLQVAERALARGNVDDVKESLAEMKQVVRRGVETVERLRAYSRQSAEAKAELVDLDALVREAAGIAKPRMASTGRVLRFVEDLHAPPRVLAAAGELISALVNLIVNAIDASKDAGKTITLRSGTTGNQSFVEVEDDGAGMTPEVERRVFEPFFTTKGQEGTGLGLAMVYATVQRLGGSISLHTEVGRGTRFRLTFPAA